MHIAIQIGEVMQLADMQLSQQKCSLVCFFSIVLEKRDMQLCD